MSVRDYIARLWTLRGAFRRTFLQADGKPNDDARVVLAELQRFCYGAKPTIKRGVSGIDPYASIAAAARQEVYMRITSYLNLDDSALQLMEKNMESHDAT
jgi:hypothetical protein